LISNDSAAPSRSRLFWFRGVAGLGLTLAVVTAACAALPAKDVPMTKRPAAALVPRPAVLAEKPAEPAPVFDCGVPVPGYVVDSPFGLRRLPWERHGRLHEGVDIAGPVGQPVLAVADGIVSKAGESPTYGRYVEVEHGSGLTSFYAHLGRIDGLAKAGAFIERGHSVGKMGSSGTSTGPHVHFEIRRDGKPLNPQVFMGREFQTLADLPLKAAAYVSPHVRIAQVSEIPASKQALMPGKAPRTEMAEAAPGAGLRVHQRLQFPSLHAGEEQPVSQVLQLAVVD
jgi:murein DD-endopeptidase MepM/ murein hydrolase activator NlpD